MKSVRFLGILYFVALMGLQIKAMEEVAEMSIPMEIDKPEVSQEVVDAIYEKDRLEVAFREINPELVPYFRVVALYVLAVDPELKQEFGNSATKIFVQYNLGRYIEFINRWLPEYKAAVRTLVMSDIKEDVMMEELLH